MKFTLILLVVVVLSVESRNTISSVSKDGRRLTLRKLLAVGQWREEREKRDVSGLNIPQLTIAANLPGEMVCSWTYRNDSDENRRPVNLVEAVCIQPSDTDDVCIKIFYFIPVQVKMTSSCGVVTWVDKLEKRAAGCGLARPLLTRSVVADDLLSTLD